MASKAAHRRLVREYMAITAAPPPLITAKPLETNILEWYYLLQGAPDTPYASGIYWGKVVFPPDYPYRPPSIRMFTPSGRFKQGERICLSMSDFHPDTWNPTWTVPTILCGLLSFMSSSEDASGCIADSAATRRLLARESHVWNKSQPRYAEIFSEYTGPNPPNLLHQRRPKSEPETSPTASSNLLTLEPAPPATINLRTAAPLKPALSKKQVHKFSLSTVSLNVSSNSSVSASSASSSAPAIVLAAADPMSQATLLAPQSANSSSSGFKAAAPAAAAKKKEAGPLVPGNSSGSLTSIAMRYKWFFVVMSVWLYFILARIASRLVTQP